MAGEGDWEGLGEAMQPTSRKSAMGKPSVFIFISCSIM
jgi:hypothetical protein